jgi:endonuclease/exonuclease/phosphatase family metal-dependent hydrolase
MKKILLYIAGLLIILILLFLAFLGFASIQEYKPAKEISLLDFCEPDTLYPDSTYSVMIWNMGYGGLGANMDFFYDGGKMVRDTRKNVEKNIQAITSYIKSNDSIDFIMLQEIDFNSKRSYHLNQSDSLARVLPDHVGFFGINYLVDFVPVPLKSPLGEVKSGIAIYTKYQPETTFRYGFNVDYSWPKRLFMLKRCYLVCRYPMKNGKQLVLVNVHNSAYDDGSLRTDQLQVLEKFAQSEMLQGNYILFGGDWNQCPDKFRANFDQPFDTINISHLPETFLQGWKRYFTDSVPSNRRIISPYERGKTPVTVIDFFIASPNITLTDVSCADLGFLNSDHHPVMANLLLKE